MAAEDLPSIELARRVLPPPLLEALSHVFSQRLSGCWLVGGTALAGFYAGHRRSDDMDLFVRDADAHAAAVLAVESLRGLGASVEVVQRSAQFFKALCRLKGHAFAADVALHAELFSSGAAAVLDNGIAVADLETLLMLKAAALLSRCGEKDLYDLLWLSGRFGGLPLERLMSAGLKIDAGMTPETLLIAVSGARPSVESCGFALGPKASPKSVCGEIRAFQKQLLAGLLVLCEKKPPPGLDNLLREVKRLLRRK